MLKCPGLMPCLSPESDRTHCKAGASKSGTTAVAPNFHDSTKLCVLLGLGGSAPGPPVSAAGGQKWKNDA
jgi:hypothetical protein